MTNENHSPQSNLSDDTIERDQRRLNLLNDPNYGLILSFLDKFGSILDIPNYSLQLFEDHLLNNPRKNSSRLIDFHFALLKRLSLAKRAQRENFDSIITKFAARFDLNDSEHLATTGYVQSDIHVKIRTIKNLLESQLDVNQTLRKTLVDRSACDIKSLPFGRDRFGVSYWLFMDTRCFVRLFREDIDIDRTWTNVAKNRDEFEEFIKLLITDSVVRKKFPDWTIDYEPFSSLPLSNEYEQRYFSTSVNIEEKSDQEMEIPIEEEKLDLSITKKRHFISEENIHEKKVKIDEDDIKLPIRRSSRLRKNATLESSSETTSQSSNTKRKVSRRRKTSSTSSSDEHIDFSSEEDDDDDYLQIDLNDPFFEFDEDITDEPLHPAKTAQTKIIQTFCFICSKNDRPEVLLLCDSCDDAYHLECLSPILFSIPDGDWFCPLCEHKKFSNDLIQKFQEFLINSNKPQLQKRSQRKIKVKQYSSDESETASESEESILSISQINENSNLSLSSSYIDDNEISSISQRGRHRRARFNMKNIIDYQDDDDDSQVTNFTVELPSKITRLFPRRHRKLIKSDSTRVSIDSNEKFHSPMHSNEDSCEIPPVLENNQQISRILRRWNDVRRRSRLKAINMKISNEILTSDYTDENSNLCHDETSLSQSNDAMRNSQINVIQSTSMIPIDACSIRNGVKKMDGNFDQLTRDIQSAVNDSNRFSTATTKTTDKQQTNRAPKKFLSLYTTKQPVPSTLFKPSGDDVHNIFKSNDSSMSNNLLTSSTDNQTMESTINI